MNYHYGKSSLEFHQRKRTKMSKPDLKWVVCAVSSVVFLYVLVQVIFRLGGMESCVEGQVFTACFTAVILIVMRQESSRVIDAIREAKEEKPEAIAEE